MKHPLLALAGCILFALTIASCTWFNQKAPVPHKDLAGTWRLDSVSTKDDSTTSLFPLLLALAVSDSTPLTISFTPDSVQTRFGDSTSETVAYRYTRPQLTVLDSTQHQYLVERTSDSALVLQASDSTRVYFLRQ